MAKLISIPYENSAFFPTDRSPAKNVNDAKEPAEVLNPRNNPVRSFLVRLKAAKMSWQKLLGNSVMKRSVLYSKPFVPNLSPSLLPIKNRIWVVKVSQLSVHILNYDARRRFDGAKCIWFVATALYFDLNLTHFADMCQGRTNIFHWLWMMACGNSWAEIELPEVAGWFKETVTPCRIRSLTYPSTFVAIPVQLCERVSILIAKSVCKRNHVLSYPLVLSRFYDLSEEQAWLL